MKFESIKNINDLINKKADEFEEDIYEEDNFIDKKIKVYNANVNVNIKIVDSGDEEKNYEEASDIYRDMQDAIKIHFNASEARIEGFNINMEVSSKN